MTPEEIRAIAQAQNERDGLGPITDPAILRKVAVLLTTWRERKAAE